MKREEGQTLAEYGVVLAVISITLMAALASFGDDIADAITRVVALF